MSNDPVFCSSCGARNEADATFCESCGAQIEEAAAAPAKPAAAAAGRAGSNANKVVAIVVVLAVLAGAAYAFRDRLTPLVDAVLVKSSPADSTNPQAQAGNPTDSLGDTPPAPITLPQGQESNLSFGDTAIWVTPPGGTSRTVTRANPSDHPPPAPVVTTRENGPPEVTSPQAPAPASTPAPTPAPAAAPAARVAAGAVMNLKAIDKVCNDKNKVGDRFTAAVQEDLNGQGGRVPRGSVVTLSITQVKPDFAVEARSINLGGTAQPLSASVDAVAFTKKGKGLLGALAGAAAGIAVTKAAGGSTADAVAGGAVGAAAGAVVGTQLKGANGCIDKNAAIKLTLREDLIVEP